MKHSTESAVAVESWSLTALCPDCRAGTRVVDSRPPHPESGGICKRRRECANGHRFTTLEVVSERQPLAGQAGTMVFQPPIDGCGGCRERQAKLDAILRELDAIQALASW